MTAVAVLGGGVGDSAPFTSWPSGASRASSLDRTSASAARSAASLDRRPATRPAGRALIQEVVRDRATRRFGIGVGVVVTVFFMFSTGLVSFVPEDGTINGGDVMATPAFVDTQPTANPLVTWPALQVWLPQIPFSGMLSVGTLLLVGLLGGLVGFNAMVAAYQWLRVGYGNSTQSTAGAAALVGPNACGCCGPMFAQLAVVLVGPSAAMPLYWLFVDFSSPVGTFFFVASVALLTGGFVYATKTLAPDVCSLPTEETATP